MSERLELAITDVTRLGADCRITATVLTRTG
jgi:hypothetical protein